MRSVSRREKAMIQELRKAIEADPRTINALAVDARIPVPVLWRFVQKQRGMTLDSAAALADALELELRKREEGRP
jgi:hypothetical protein